MYYKGFPLNEFSLISHKDVTNEQAFFYKKETVGIKKSNVFERIVNEKIDLVVYQDVLWNDEQLLEYHSHNYNGLPFYTENKVGENVYKITIVTSDLKISGINIIQYDSFYRPVIEQFFDENHLLLEYRKLFYMESGRLPIKEKIFFSSWHISEEKK